MATRRYPASGNYSGGYLTNNEDDGYVWRIQRERNYTTLADNSSQCYLGSSSVLGFYYSNGATLYRRTMYENIQYKSGSSYYSCWKGNVFSNVGKGEGYYTFTFSGSWPVVSVSTGSGINQSPTGYGVQLKISHKGTTKLTLATSTYNADYYGVLPAAGAPYYTANSFSGSVSVPSSAYNTNYFTVSYRGSATTNNSSVEWRTIYGSTVVASGSGGSYSGSVSRRITSNGTYTFYTQYRYSYSDGSYSSWTSVGSDSITISDPPPSKPDMGAVNNTTPSSVDTSVSKKISANWVLDYNGRLSTSFTAKAYKKNRDTGAVTEVYSYSGTGTSASTTINLALNENVDVYWIVTATNSLGSDSTTSGSVRVHRIYTEPSNVSSVSVSPTSVMMVNGTTSQLYNVSVNVNAWGDRPGTKELVIFQCHDGTKKTEVFRKTETGTGKVTMQFTASVDESYYGNHLRFLVEKRMGGTVYNNTTAYTNYVNMYETKAVLSGSATMSRSTITVGKQLTVTYNYNYKKYSSEKVQFILELFNETLNTVVDSWTLQTKTADATYTGSQSIIPFTSDGEQDHKYVIRLKSVVTELLGNQTTTILGSSPLQYNYPPIVQLSQTGSIPMNANGTIIRFDSDITYSANIIYKDAIDHSEVILKTSQGEFKGTLVNGKWIWDNPGELALNSKPEAFVRVYYDLGGTIETYDSPKYTIQVIPTRYIVYHTDNLVQEMRNPKLHLKISAGDEGYATKFQLTQG